MLNREKLDALIVWIANCPDVRDLGYTKLWKLLYFMDATALRELGHTITGSDYIKYEHGPVPSRGEREMKILIRNGAVNTKQRPHGPHIINEILPVAAASDDLFTPEEMKIVHRVCREMGKLSAGALSGISHQEPAWVYAEPPRALSQELMAYGSEEDADGL